MATPKSTPDASKTMSAKFDRFNARIVGQSDVILIALLFAIISLMIIPVPQTWMDFMIATNMMLAVTVLVTAMSLRDASRLPAFPAILLLTTLFRLGLNVATTRLILLEADAGEIINAFGNFVVAGNYIVGGVVFLVLVIVQFVVIAKGSERVAEVSARFTLDAMQGKQMGIDRDVNAGLDKKEAARRRAALDRESRLYGAMDGAMKFVKGDAIAGIIISLVNIVGGLVIGVVQADMSIGDAAGVYTLLTIGDGLVSQIPSLLISISAGIVVTRVASTDEEDGESHLGRDLVHQFLQHRKALLVVAVAAFVLGISDPVLGTGFPTLPFLVLSGLFAGVSVPALLRARAERTKREQDGDGDVGETTNDDDDASPAGVAMPARTPAIQLRFGPMLTPVVGDAKEKDDPAATDFRKELNHTRSTLSTHYGIPFPEIMVVNGDSSVGPSGYAIMLHGAPVATGRVSPNRMLLMATPAHAKAAGLDEIADAILPWTGDLVCTVPSGRAEAATEQGIQVLSPIEVIRDHVTRTLHAQAAELLGTQEVAILLEALRRSAPALVEAVTPKLMTPSEIGDVLRALLYERIPVADLRGILESLVRHAASAEDPMDLVDRVREDNARAICHAYQSGMRQLKAARLTREVVDVLERGLRDGDGVTPVLSSEDRRSIVDGVQAVIQGWPRPTREYVLMVPPSLRRPMRMVLASSTPPVMVMSNQELAPEFELFPAGQVELA